jgi:hypothetical protein
MTDFDTAAPLWTTRRKAILGGLLAIQFAVAYLVGTQHLLVNTSGGFFAPIVLTVVVPVLTFLGAFALAPKFRSFVLAQNPRTLTLIQLWRVMGFGFLTLYAINHLPAVFAIPAGFGDIMVGLLALVMVHRLDRDPDYVTAPGFTRFHLFGLADFAVAIVATGLTSGFLPALNPGGVTSAPMDIWPLNLFPTFFVPSFIIVQLTAILIAAHRRRAVEQAHHAFSTA